MRSSIIVACLLVLQVVAAQNVTISKQQRKETVKNAADALKNQYIFPEVADKMAAWVEKQNMSGKYNKLTGEEFAAALTRDLRSINNDGHIRVMYSPEILPPSDGKVKMYIPDEQKPAQEMMLKHTNYGIAKLEVLPGNIGYIDFNFFGDPEFAGDTYSAALNYVSHTDALIIDLRHCGGSLSPDAVPFICSYFFEQPVHLSTIYWREGREPLQSWTKSDVFGKKYLDKPIYILTSASTFSGAEEMAYDLKALQRATVIGGVTGGGANPGGDVRIADHYSMFIPVGRAENPLTK